MGANKNPVGTVDTWFHLYPNLFFLNVNFIYQRYKKHFPLKDGYEPGRGHSINLNKSGSSYW
jgi:hypothetical protein